MTMKGEGGGDEVSEEGRGSRSGALEPTIVLTISFSAGSNTNHELFHRF